MLGLFPPTVPTFETPAFCGKCKEQFTREDSWVLFTDEEGRVKVAHVGCVGEVYK